MVGDIAGNVEQIHRSLEAAASAEADLVVFPELTVAGYPPEDLLLRPRFARACEAAVDRVAREVGDFVASGQLGPQGRLPINTDGGGLSSNHSGRRGMYATIEAVRQLRGESPGLQLPDPELCLVSGTGGWLSATSTLILGNAS